MSAGRIDEESARPRNLSGKVGRGSCRAFRGFQGKLPALDVDFCETVLCAVGLIFSIENEIRIKIPIKIRFYIVSRKLGLLFLKRIPCKNHVVFVSNYGTGNADDLLRDTTIGFKITEIVSSTLQAAADVVDFYLPRVLQRQVVNLENSSAKIEVVKDNRCVLVSNN